MLINTGYITRHLWQKSSKFAKSFEPWVLTRNCCPFFLCTHEVDSCPNSFLIVLLLTWTVSFIFLLPSSSNFSRFKSQYFFSHSQEVYHLGNPKQRCNYDYPWHYSFIKCTYPFIYVGFLNAVPQTAVGSFSSCSYHLEPCFDHIQWSDSCTSYHSWIETSKIISFGHNTIADTWCLEILFPCWLVIHAKQPSVFVKGSTDAIFCISSNKRPLSIGHLSPMKRPRPRPKYQTSAHPPTPHFPR